MQAHIFIKGKVTGVFFRALMSQEASRVGVTGWVRNIYKNAQVFGELPGVEAVLQGEKDAIAQIIRWARKGPPNADVADVIVEWEDETEVFNSFEIL